MAPKKRAMIAAICLLLALSPVGAPAFGFLIASTCPVDTTVVPDGPFAMEISYCGLSRPMEHYYQKAMFLPLSAVVMAGPMVGGAIALAWVLTAFLLPLAFVWHLARLVGPWRNAHL